MLTSRELFKFIKEGNNAQVEKFIKKYKELKEENKEIEDYFNTIIDDETCLQAAETSGNADLIPILHAAGAKLQLNNSIPMRERKKISETQPQASLNLILPSEASLPESGNSSNKKLLYDIIERKDIASLNKYIKIYRHEKNKSNDLSKDIFNSLLDENDTPLTLAVKQDSPELIRLLVTAGANIDVECAQDHTPIILASRLGRLNALTCLIELNADVNKKSSKADITAMGMAAQMGQADAIRILFHAKANINEPILDGQSPIFMATMGNHIPALNELILLGADVNISKKNGLTAAYFAAQQNFHEALLLLINAGANLNTPLKESTVNAFLKGETSVITAARKNCFESLKIIIESKKIDLNKQRSDGKTAIFLAMENNNIESFTILLEAGADIAIPCNGDSKETLERHAIRHNKKQILIALKDYDGKVQPTKKRLFQIVKNNNLASLEAFINKYLEIKEKCKYEVEDIFNSLSDNEETPLTSATMQNSPESIRLLVKAGANINLESFDGPPVLIASYTGKIEALNCLIGLNADVNKRSTSGVTPMGIAAQRGHADVIRTLFYAKANINDGGVGGQTPIISAAGQNKISALNELILLGADVNIPRQDGLTATYIAAQENYYEALRVLITAGAELNMPINIKAGSPLNGETAIITAARHNSFESIKLIINSGRADLNKQRFDGKTAIFIAMEENHVESFDILLNSGADINITNNANQNESLEGYAVRTNKSQILEILRKYDERNPPSKERFFQALEHNNINSFEVIVKKYIVLEKESKENANSIFNCLSDKEKLKPISFAILHDSPALIQLLILAGAKVDLESEDGLPTLIAVSEGKMKALECLISLNANVNKKGSKFGSTPILMAAGKGNVKAITMLHSAKADINACDFNGETPVIVATGLNKTAALQELIRLGANVNIPRNDNLTPAYVAAQKNYLEELQMLIAAGADLNKPFTDSETAIFAAVRGNHDQALALILASKRAHLNIRSNQQGATCIFIAAAKGNATIFQMLRDAGADINIPSIVLEQHRTQNQVIQSHKTLTQYVIEKGIRPILEILNARLTYSKRLEQINYSGSIPEELTDLSTLEIMDDPIIATDGVNSYVYDRQSFNQFKMLPDGRRKNPIDQSMPLENKITISKMTHKQLEAFVSEQEKLAQQLTPSNAENKADIISKNIPNSSLLPIKTFANTSDFKSSSSLSAFSIASTNKKNINRSASQHEEVPLINENSNLPASDINMVLNNEKKTSYTSVITTMFANAVKYSVTAGASGAVGALVLDQAGYTGYDILQQAEAGLVGGPGVGAAIGFFGATKIIPAEYRKKIDTFLIAATPALSGVVGYAILKSFTEIDLGKTTAALAVGGGIFTATGIGITATFCIGACCLFSCFGYRKILSNSTANNLNEINDTENQNADNTSEEDSDIQTMLRV